MSWSCSSSLCHSWHVEQIHSFPRIMGQKCSYYKSSYLFHKAHKKTFSFYLGSAEICMKCYLPCTPTNMALAYHSAFIQDIISSPWHVINHATPSLSAHSWQGGALVHCFSCCFLIHLGWAHNPRFGLSVWPSLRGETQGLVLATSRVIDTLEKFTWIQARLNLCLMERWPSSFLSEGSLGDGIKRIFTALTGRICYSM